MSMQEMTMEEIEQVSGAVTPGQVLNYGAAIVAVGGAVLGGTAAIVGAPIFGGAVLTYAAVSAGMWLGSAAYDIYY